MHKDDLDNHIEDAVNQAEENGICDTEKRDTHYRSLRNTVKIMQAAVIVLTVFAVLAVYGWSMMSMTPEEQNDFKYVSYMAVPMVIAFLVPITLAERDIFRALLYFLPDTADRAAYKTVFHIVGTVSAILMLIFSAVDMLAIGNGLILVAAMFLWSILWIILRIAYAAGRYFEKEN